MLSNPYETPKESGAITTPRFRFRDPLYAGAGCFLTVAMIFRTADWVHSVAYFFVVVVVFGLLHRAISNPRSLRQRGARVVVCGGISGAICGTMCHGPLYGFDFAQPIAVTRFAIAVFFGTGFAICGTCLGFGIVRLHDGELDPNTDALKE